MLKDSAARNYKAYEGILAGYVTIRPKEGWAFAQDLLKNEKNFALRYAALRTMRFFYNARPEDGAAEVLKGMETAIVHADVADIAIQICAVERWDHTKLIVACYDKQSHKSPIVKNSIVCMCWPARNPKREPWWGRLAGKTRSWSNIWKKS